MSSLERIKKMLFPNTVEEVKSFGYLNDQATNVIHRLERHIGYDYMTNINKYATPVCRHQRWKNRVPIPLEDGWYLEAVEGNMWFVNPDLHLEMMVATLMPVNNNSYWVLLVDEDDWSVMKEVANMLNDVYWTIRV